MMMSLRFVLLALLSKEQNTGYGLDRLLRGHAPHLWSTSLQHIYGELANMQADGLTDVESVEVPNRPVNKKVYSLTRLGEEKLNGLLSESIALPSVKDDLLIRLFCIDRISVEDLEREMEEHVQELESEELAMRKEAFTTAPSDTGSLLSIQLVRGRVRERLSSCRRILSVLRGAKQKGIASVSDASEVSDVSEAAG